jgi:phthalate 4,5-cis-dihydrodiol dehydrogenase
MGIIGVGPGGADILPGMYADKGLELVAVADTDPYVRQQLAAHLSGVAIYATAEGLCADPDVDAVWISTPNRYHAEHAILAAEHGKHVIAEKPIANTMAEADAVIGAAHGNDVRLVAGHTLSYSLQVRAMRKIIQSGKLGPLRAIHALSYTDWMLRPRSDSDLTPETGGGVPHRQGPHQIDSIRLLGGGELRSVRGTSGQWMPQRPGDGYYSAYLEFEDGTPCTIVHNGYGYFTIGQLIPWQAAAARSDTAQQVELRRAIQRRTRDEESEKHELRVGGSAGRGIPGQPRTDWTWGWGGGDLGLLIASCERGDIRHSPHGLFVHDDDGTLEIDLTGLQADQGERREELTELYNSVVLGEPVYHTGEWGRATIEAVLAIIESGRERAEVRLSHQVPIDPAYDRELRFPYIDGSGNARS